MHFPPAKLIVVACLVGFGGNFQMAYQLSVVNNAESAFRAALNTSWYQSFNRSITHDEYACLWTFAVNVIYPGALLGVLLASLAAEGLGRKKAILLNNLPSALGTLLICVWPPSGSFEFLVVGRFLVGIHAGLSTVLQALYLIEISIAEYRGVVGAFQELTTVSIFVFGATMGLPEALGNKDDFMFLLAIPAIPLIIHTIGMLLLPETPKYLLLVLRDAVAAKKSIEFFNGVQPDEKLAEFIVTIEHDVLEKIPSASLGFHYTPRTIKIATAVGVVAAASQTFTGIDALENFSTSVFTRVGVDESTARWMTLVQEIVKASASLIALSFIDRIGRRILLLSSLAGCCLCNCVFTVVTQLEDSSAGAVGFVFSLHGIFFSIGAGQISWFLASELVPQAYRSSTQTIATSVLWLTAILTSAVFYPLNSSEAGSLSLLIFIVPTVFCIVFLFFFMPETRDKEVTEILADLEARSSRRFMRRDAVHNSHGSV